MQPSTQVSLTFRTAFNSETTRISRLPPEILAYIFEITIYSKNPSRSSLKRRLQLTQICRQWRSIILNRPTFWSTIHGFEPLATLDETLKRSRGIPLRIHSRTEISVELAKRLLAELPRVKVLACVFFSEDMSELEPMLAQPAPSIEALQLTFQPRNPESVDALVMTPYGYPLPPLPSTIFGGQSPPRLKSLALSYCTVEWTSPIFTRNLTDLRLHFIKRPSYAVFVTFLRGLPALETLYLRDSCPLVEEASFLDHPHDAVNLPQLRVLSLEDNFDVCTLFLRTVAFYPVELVVFTGSACATPSDFELLWEYINRRLSTVLKKHPINEISIDTRSLFDLGVVTVKGYAHISEASACLIQRTLALTTFSEDDPTTFENILTAVFTYGPFEKVTIARFKFDRVFPDDLWIEVVAQKLRVVNTIHLTPPAFRHFSEVYLRWQGRTPRPFKKLRFLAETSLPVQNDWKMVEPIGRRRYFHPSHP